MDNTQTKDAPRTEAQQYLDMVYSSWPAIGFIRRNGRDMLVNNLAMTEKDAQAEVDKWIQAPHGVKR